jgi:NADH:ubiquinone oxidoreductase subunit 3 (subunit A)
MNPLGDARQKFNIQYFLVGILFIVFDLEIIFLFPYATVLYENSYLAFWSMSIFLLILTIGFIYEYTKGALKWV